VVVVDLGVALLLLLFLRPELTLLPSDCLLVPELVFVPALFLLLSVFPVEVTACLVGLSGCDFT
jgi:hypothetical protein